MPQKGVNATPAFVFLYFDCMFIQRRENTRSVALRRLFPTTSTSNQPLCLEDVRALFRKFGRGFHQFPMPLGTARRFRRRLMGRVLRRLSCATRCTAT